MRIDKTRVDADSLSWLVEQLDAAGKDDCSLVSAAITASVERSVDVLWLRQPERAAALRVMGNAPSGLQELRAALEKPSPVLAFRATA